MEKDKMVYSPEHYNQGDLETIKLIELMLTPEEFRGYLKGNIIKYRDRAGVKTPDPERDYKKAKWYYDYTLKKEKKCSCGTGGCCKDKSDSDPVEVKAPIVEEEPIKTVGGDDPIYFVDELPEEDIEYKDYLTEMTEDDEGSKDYAAFINLEDEEVVAYLNQDDSEKLIIDDYLAGVPNTYIISKYGINKNKLYSILNKNKIPRKTNKSEVLDYIYNMEEDILIQILDEYESGISKASLSDKYELTTYEINTIIDIFR